MFFRKMLIVLSALVVFFASCGSSESDVLASYKEGKKRVSVTRGEFYKYLGRRANRALRDKISQKNYLENYIIERLKSIEAKKAGLDKSADFKKQLNDYIDRRLLVSQFLNSEFPRTKQVFSVKAKRISHIIIKRNEYKKLVVPDPKRFKKMQNARKNIKDKKKLQARLKVLAKSTITKRIKLNAYELKKHEMGILAKIKKVKSELKTKKFGTLARRYSEDGTKSKGGDLGFIFSHQRNMDKKFLAAALKLKKGEVSGIVNSSFGYHLIKCVDIKTITDKSIEKMFPNAAMRKKMEKMSDKDKKRSLSQANREKRRMLDHIWYSRVWNFIEDTLKNDKYVKQSKDKLGSINKKTVVFEIASPDYKHKTTLDDFIKQMKKLRPYTLRRFGIKRSNKDMNKPYTVKERKAYYNWYVTFPVLKYGAYKKGVVKKQAFKDAIAKVKPNILAKIFNKSKKDTIKITDAEIKKEYKNNKKSYVKRERIKLPRGQKAKYKTTQLTFFQAKERVKKNLINRKNRVLMSRLKTDLLNKYSIKIFEDKFEIKKSKSRRPRMRRGRRPRMKRGRKVPKGKKMPIKIKKK